MANEFKTEYNFYDEVSRVAFKFQLNEVETSMLSMYCAQNGYDCGKACWNVAISTLEDLVDQNQVLNVAREGETKY